MANNGTAADIESTGIDINLLSLSSSNAVVGLKLVTAPGTFDVFGNPAQTVGSGGTIQGSTVGILLQNVGTVAFASMKSRVTESASNLKTPFTSVSRTRR